MLDSIDRGSVSGTSPETPAGVAGAVDEVCGGREQKRVAAGHLVTEL